MYAKASLFSLALAMLVSGPGFKPSQDNATASSCLVLATALMVSHRIQTTKRPYYDYQTQVCHLLIPKKSHSIHFQVTKQKVLFCH